MEGNQLIKRPAGVTVIAWILVIFGIVGIVADLATMGSASKEAMELGVPTYLYFVSFCVSIIYLICGFCLLKGVAWARWLYIVASIALIVIDFVAVGRLMLTGIIVNIVILVIFSAILFSGQSNAFFRR